VAAVALCVPLAALLAAERARAQSDAVTDKLQSALTYLEGKVAFSTAVANDYATRVNCATAHATFADSFAQKNRSSAVYLQVRSMGQGQFDLRFIALHLSVCAMALFVTVKIMENRRRV